MVSPAQLVRQRPQSRQPTSCVLPKLAKELSQKKFADFADGDDSFYTTRIRGRSPPRQPWSTRSASITRAAASPRPTATETDVKGKGRVRSIMTGLLGDSPEPDCSFGVGPTSLHTLVHQGRVRSVLLRVVLLSRWRRVRYPLRVYRLHTRGTGRGGIS